MRVIALVATTLLASPAFAVGDITNCIGLDSDLDRLACYDKESGRTPVVERAKPKNTTGKWQIRTSKSAMTDSTDHFMSIMSGEDIQCRSYGDTERPHLIIRCRENTTAIMLQTQSCHLASSQYSGYGNIEYRVDDLPSGKEGFSASTSNKTLGLWKGGKAIPFVKRMLGHDKITMRFTPYGESAKTLTFDIRGIDEAIKPLREACSW